MGTKERERKVEKRGIIEITSGECNERNIIGGLKYKMHNRHRKKGEGKRGRIKNGRKIINGETLLCEIYTGYITIRKR